MKLDNAVAEVDGKEYEKLEDAIDNAQNGDTITLLADATLSKNYRLSADKEITLDLNGWTVTSETAGTWVLMVQGKLTLEDSDGNGKITTMGDNGHNSYAVIVNGSGSSLNMESGMIECDEDETALQVQLGAKFQMHGGVIYGDPEGGDNGGLIMVGGQATIDGGRIETGGTAVQVAAYEDYPAALTLEDGEISGGNFGITVIGVGKKDCQATLEIHGGTIISPNGAAITGNGTNEPNNSSAWTTIKITDGEIQGVVGMYLP